MYTEKKAELSSPFTRCFARGESSPCPNMHVYIVAQAHQQNLAARVSQSISLLLAAIKTDLYVKVARKHTPSESSKTDKEIDEVVCFSFLLFGP